MIIISIVIINIKIIYQMNLHPMHTIIFIDAVFNILHFPKKQVKTPEENRRLKEAETQTNGFNV